MSSAQTALDMKELQNINTEIKRLSKQIMMMKNKKKELEDNILEYLKDTDSEALRYKDMLVISKERKHRDRKNKTDKENDIINILNEAGVMDSMKVLNNIQGAMKGKEHVVNCLTIKDSGNGIFLE